MGKCYRCGATDCITICVRCANELVDRTPLEQAAPALLEALEAVEWITHIGSGSMTCPWCGGFYPDHAADCQRQAALREARGESGGED